MSPLAVPSALQEALQVAESRLSALRPRVSAARSKYDEARQARGDGEAAVERYNWEQLYGRMTLIREEVQRANQRSQSFYGNLRLSHRARSPRNRMIWTIRTA